MNAKADRWRALRVEQLRRELARRSLVEQARWVSPEHAYERWHEEVAVALDWLLSGCGDSRRLLIEAPPGHGKTEIIGRNATVAFMGRNPGAGVLYATHTQDPTADRVSRDVRERAKVCSRLWPHLSHEPMASGRECVVGVRYWETQGGGFFRAVGVGAGTAGTHVGFAVVDDPFANAAAARSSTTREEVWEWIGRDVESRLTRSGGPLAMTHTRWHMDDAAGRVRASGKCLPWPGADKAVGGVWYVMSHPAIAEVEGADWRAVGEALCPITMGIAKLEAIRNSPTMTPQAFGSLYQQRPTDDADAVVQRDWTLKRHRFDYAAATAMRWDDIILSADLTFGASATSDYCSMQVWGRLGPDRYLLDRINKRLTYTEARQALRDLCGKWPNVRAKLIERAANGAAMVDELSREIPGVIPVKVTGRVVPEKFATTAHLWQAGNVLLPDATIAPWVVEYAEQIASVPAAAHDDDAAATAHALTYWQEGKAEPTADDHARAATTMATFGGGAFGSMPW